MSFTFHFVFPRKKHFLQKHVILTNLFLGIKRFHPLENINPCDEQRILSEMFFFFIFSCSAIILWINIYSLYINSIMDIAVRSRQFICTQDNSTHFFSACTFLVQLIFHSLSQFRHRLFSLWLIRARTRSFHIGFSRIIHAGDRPSTKRGENH